MPILIIADNFTFVRNRNFWLAENLTKKLNLFYITA